MMNYQKLKSLLDSTDKNAVREAAFSAGETGCVEAVPRLTELLQSENLGVQEAAEIALRKIGGPETLRSVIPLLRSENVPVRNMAMVVLRNVSRDDVDPVIELLSNADQDLRIFAADILGSSGSRAAVEPLCDVLIRDPESNVRYQAAVSLGELRDKAAADCLNRAIDDDEWVTFAVIEALTKIQDESSIGAMISALDNTSDLLASVIVDGLGKMGNLKAVPLLLNRLDHTDPALRNKMAEAVVRLLGPKGIVLLSSSEQEKVARYLLGALDDDDEEIQDAAIQGLSFLGSVTAGERIMELAGELDPVADYDRLEGIVDALTRIGPIEALERALHHGSWKRGVVAVRTMAGLSDAKIPTILKNGFWDKDRDLQREVISALVVTADASDAEFFQDVLKRHDDGHTIKEALRFLGQTLRNNEAADILLNFLDHPYGDVKEVALDGLIALGMPEIIQRFREMLRSNEDVSRLMAVYGLGRMGASMALPELKEALEDEVPDIRKLALEAIAGLCESTADILPIIVSRLHDESKEVRLTLVELLGKCDRDEVEPYLFEALRDHEDWVRIRAIEALGERRLVRAVPLLVPLLCDPNKMVGLKVVEALGRISSPESFQALMDVLSGDDPELQAGAQEILAQMRSGE
jgi:HEAT repeat protein